MIKEVTKAIQKEVLEPFGANNEMTKKIRGLRETSCGKITDIKDVVFRSKTFFPHLEDENRVHSGKLDTPQLFFVFILPFPANLAEEEAT